MKSIEEINKYIEELKANNYSVKSISDTHHTFGDYIEMRNVLFIALCNAYKDISWKSKRHYNEEYDPMYNDDFIAGINTPDGVVAFHLKMKYWDLLDVMEITSSPEYDGYTYDDVINRINSLNNGLTR